MPRASYSFTTDSSRQRRLSQANVMLLMTSYDWEVLPYPAYSPDISSSDFDIFPKLKELLIGVKFEDFNTLEAEVANQVRRINLG